MGEKNLPLESPGTQLPSREQFARLIDAQDAYPAALLEGLIYRADEKQRRLIELGQIREALKIEVMYVSITLKILHKMQDFQGKERSKNKLAFFA